jgi:hypothetical protein
MKFLYHRPLCAIDSIFRQTNVSRATKSAPKLNDEIVRATPCLAALVGALLVVSIAVQDDGNPRRAEQRGIEMFQSETNYGSRSGD